MKIKGLSIIFRALRWFRLWITYQPLSRKPRLTRCKTLEKSIRAFHLGMVDQKTHISLQSPASAGIIRAHTGLRVQVRLG